MEWEREVKPTVHGQRESGGEETPRAWVQLTGQLAVMPLIAFPNKNIEKKKWL